MDYPIAMDQRMLLIDATGLVFRAYFSIGPLTAPDGTPVNAVFGLLRILIKLFRDLPASASAIVFDAGAKTFRNEIYALYKAHRPPPPDDLRPQFALAIELARACQAPVFIQPGFEADDIIATLARQAEAAGMEVDILTGDRDILQLISPQVHVLLPQKSGEFKEYYAGELHRRVRLWRRALPGLQGADGRSVGQHPRRARHRPQDGGQAGRAPTASWNSSTPTSISSSPTACAPSCAPRRTKCYLYRELVTLRHDAPVSYDFAARTLPNFGSRGAAGDARRLGL